VVRGDRVFAETVRFAHEHPLSLAVGGQVVTVLMATPGRERELAAGYALTMGWALPGDPPPAVAYDPERGRVDLDLHVPPEKLGGARAAGGGLLGPTEADPLPFGGRLELGVLRTLTEAMSAAQTLYSPTRGTHAAALFDAQGKMLALAEDVGRHNGLDKAVGTAWLAGDLTRAAALALSGRCSLEMVLKAVRSGVGVVTSVSAPTVPAVETAERLGLTLVNCAKRQELKIYTHPARITVGGGPLEAT
jgi:FdhD protein